MSMEPYFWWAAMASVLVGLSKGGLPSIAMLAVPLMALVMSPMQATVLLLPIYVMSDAVGLWLYRKNCSWPNLKYLIPGGIMGVGVGWATASIVSDRFITLLIGLMGVVFCLNTWLRKPAELATQPHRTKGIFWGSLAGFTSFISHAGAPPFQVYILPQRLPKLVYAGTSTVLFSIVNSAKIVPYHFLRPTDAQLWVDSLVLVPFALVGTVLGAYLTKKIADAWFFRLVQIGLFVVSVRLVIDAVQGK